MLSKYGLHLIIIIIIIVISFRQIWTLILKMFSDFWLFFQLEFIFQSANTNLFVYKQEQKKEINRAAQVFSAV